MKTVAGLLMALITCPVLAAGIYEFDQTQWEKKPAETTTASKPARHTGTQATAPAKQAPAQAQTATKSTADTKAGSNGEVVQSHSCPPGHACNDLQ